MSLIEESKFSVCQVYPAQNKLVLPQINEAANGEEESLKQKCRSCLSDQNVKIFPAVKNGATRVQLLNQLQKMIEKKSPILHNLFYSFGEGQEKDNSLADILMHDSGSHFICRKIPSFIQP